MKTPYILLFLFASQAHAGFMFCESKLKKIGLTKEEAKSACASSFIDSTKKMLETEDPKEMAKVIKLMSSSVNFSFNYNDIRNFKTYYEISDPQIALKVVKRLPDDALANFYSLVKKFGLDDSVKMASLLPPEKMVYAHKIAENYSANQASFYNLINTATTDQLATYTLLLEKFSDEKAASLIPKYTKKDVECGLSFTQVSSSENRKYEDYMSLCSQYHSGKLCNSKAMLFATALKDRTSSMGPRLMDHLMASDHYTKNHALIFDKIYSAGFYSNMYNTTEKLLKNEIISDELTNQVLKEFENPFVTSNMIEGLMKPALSNTTITGRTFEKSGSVTANWGNGSFSACSSNNGRAAINRAIIETQSECENFYKGKKSLNCDVEIDQNKSQGICKFKVTMKSTFDRDQAAVKSCYDQDLQDGLTAVNKINAGDKKDDSALINETRLQKDVEKSPSTENKIDSTKTSDR